MAMLRHRKATSLIVASLLLIRRIRVRSFAHSRCSRGTQFLFPVPTYIHSGSQISHKININADSRSERRCYARILGGANLRWLDNFISRWNRAMRFSYFSSKSYAIRKRV